MGNNFVHYRYFKLPEDGSFSSYDLEHGRSLGILSTVNLFIGQNNSGKSRLLRMIYSDRGLEYRTAPEVCDSFNLAVDRLKEVIRSKYIAYFSQYQFPRPDSINPLEPGFFRPTHHPYHRMRDFLSKIRKVGESIPNNDARSTKAREEIAALANDLESMIDLEYPQKFHEEKRFYIPILRGLRTLPHIEHRTEDATAIIPTPVHLLQHATLRDYFQRNRPTHGFSWNLKNSSIFTGLEMYGLLKNMLLGLPEQRERIRRYEEFLGKHFFANQRVTLIPRDGDDIVHVKIGNDEQRPIYDLGDGLQALIICTFNTYIEEERCSFFIEEPDTFMHPGMQRAFLSALRENPQHQYFITTHSNHMLDMTLDFKGISVFQFHRHEENRKVSFRIRLSSSDDRNLLRELGVQNSSVFLTNATIWVEGITDRLYLRAYMKKYLEELRELDEEQYRSCARFSEDTHYSFVEYQGSCLGHWFENANEDTIDPSVLCGPALVIADGDVQGKRRGAQLKDVLGDKLVFLKCKEIENLMPQIVLSEVVPTVYGVDARRAKLLLEKEYCCQDIRMGDYLAEKLIPDRIEGSNQIQELSGTLKKKLKLCSEAERIMASDFEWSLSEMVRELVDTIYKHIASCN